MKFIDKNIKVLTLSKNKIKFFIFLFFFLYFIVGISIYKDYGISIDEPFQRTSGHFWMITVIENFFPNYEKLEIIKSKMSQMEWGKEMLNGQYLQYGPFFDLFSAILENGLNLKSSSDIFFFKHLLNFIVFYISSIFVFFIIKTRFKNNFLPFFGTFFYISSPRIFAESFYNCKDIIFMSFMVYALYFCLKSLRKYNFKNLFLFSLFAAIATDIRIMGIGIVIIFLIFFLIECLENKKIFFKKVLFILFFILSYFFLTYLFWPYLWDDPFNKIIYAFNSFSNYDWENSVFYFGKFIMANNLPWHYILVWIGITTPLFYLVLFLIGLFIVFNKLKKNFLNLDHDGGKKLFCTFEQKIDFIMLAYFLLPVVAVILFNSTLYGGWRHLYFVFPSIIYLSIYGIEFLLNIKIKFIKTILFGLVFLCLINNIKNIIKLHPFQNIYFNIIAEKRANKLFEIDSWGLANSKAIEFILKDSDDKKEINVRTASFTPLEYSVNITNNERINKLNLDGTVDLGQKYIFTNYIYERDPKFTKKYIISNEYKKIYSLRKGNIIINEIFKK